MPFSRRALAGLCALLVPSAFVPGCGGDDPAGTSIDPGTASGGQSSGDSAADGSRGPCGNGILDPNELCDDTNETAGDGCAADCRQIEPGFACTRVGAACVPLCGDGIR
ncbi:MAG: DUF4215 domain-containing protein, partial [Proteobacteria bacterium]